MPSYIFEGVEIKPTGKTASRKTRSGKEETIHEVTPVSQQIGSWKEWVDLTTLYIVNDDTSEVSQ